MKLAKLINGTMWDLVANILMVFHSIGSTLREETHDAKV